MTSWSLAIDSGNWTSGFRCITYILPKSHRYLSGTYLNIEYKAICVCVHYTHKKRYRNICVYIYMYIYMYVFGKFIPSIIIKKKIREKWLPYKM